MLTGKENAMRLFRHEKTEYIPKYGDGIINNVPVNGYHERPEGGRGGKDWFGVTWEYHEGEPAPMPSQDYLFEEMEDWKDAVHFPDLEHFDWEEAARKDRIPEFDREHHMLSQIIHNGVFERLNTLMGMENSMCALLTDPEECKSFFDACAEYKCRLIDKLHQYYQPDVIVYHDDWGAQKSLMIDPDTWRELIKPATAKICEHTKRLGMFFELHSDGMIRDLVPEIAEDIQPDAIQLMAMNDIPALKKITGNRIVYDVFLDTQKIAAMDTGKLTEEELRRMLREEFTTLAEGGCYIPSILLLDRKWKDVIEDTFEQVRRQVYC